MAKKCVKTTASYI